MSSLLVLFGRAVRRFRLAAGYSQESFADAIGVHRNYIGTVERGETNITLENIGRIARGLKEPIWMLLREMESLSSERAAEVNTLPARTEADAALTRARIPVTRVAERRVEVREQLAGLLTELTQLERIAVPSKPAPKKRKKR
jgi:transcriptional regulator with XRE-family HTH domain